MQPKIKTIEEVRRKTHMMTFLEDRVFSIPQTNLYYLYVKFGIAVNFQAINL